jgi:hypothetical protein
MSERFVNGARVTNQERLILRALVAREPKPRRPKVNPDALALARSRPTKGWAKRYLRARGLSL